jgi:hypothetical protein
VHRDQAEVSKHGERQRFQQHAALKQDHESALVDPVGDHAAVEGEQENRQRA